MLDVKDAKKKEANNEDKEMLDVLHQVKQKQGISTIQAWKKKHKDQDHSTSQESIFSISIS